MKPKMLCNFRCLAQLLLLLLLLLLLSFTSFGKDTITSNSFIKDPDFITSNGSDFTLGFFTPLNSTGRYVGIWFNQTSEKTIVWVANRDKPLNDNSGIFTINREGNLVVSDGKQNILWSSNVNSSSSTTNRSARILDSGNLVLEDIASGNTIWESFKHPSDILLPSMKLTTNKITKEKMKLTSWNTPSNPSTGNFSLAIELLSLLSIPEAVIWKNGGKIHWRSGSLKGRGYSGIVGRHKFQFEIGDENYNLSVDDSDYTLSSDSPYRADNNPACGTGNPYAIDGCLNSHNPRTPSTYRHNFGGMYPGCDKTGNPHSIKSCGSSHHTNSKCLYCSIVLTSEGNLVSTDWTNYNNKLNVRWSALQTKCDYYGTCGAFGICDPNVSPICSCLKGFKPKNEKEWHKGNWSEGCVRRMPLQCINKSAEEDAFLTVNGVKFPYFGESSNLSFTSSDCERECLNNNCSCNAYAYEDSSCMLWRSTDELIDIQKLESDGASLYLRVSYAESESEHTNNYKGIIIVIVLPTAFVVFIIIAISFWWKFKTHRHEKKKKEKMILKFTREDDMIIEDSSALEELPLYDFEKLAIATNNFDISNKLGQGGFGPVYKGTMLNGQEIAVKRLSRASNQGYEEFINEVKVISKLQHRNLVRLLGCCIEREEKMLIYEYMPHLSLDASIFGSPKQELLDWRRRFNIIDGIARGLLYLHRDSRLKIIHRDLKASNILIDQDLNPKISDFGMARIFCGNEVEANTKRVVGTYGYMSPEYAMQGQFSEKSDVFSFGVLLLEIISGRRNTEFYHHEQAISLLGFAWKLWTEDNLIPMIEPKIYELCYQPEIFRCIQVGLLCVQEFVNDRPNVSTIISMLNSEIINLPSPKEPGFVGRANESNTDSSQQNLDKYSVNSVSLSTVIAR